METDNQSSEEKKDEKEKPTGLGTNLACGALLTAAIGGFMGLMVGQIIINNRWAKYGEELTRLEQVADVNDEFFFEKRKELGQAISHFNPRLDYATIEQSIGCVLGSYSKGMFFEPQHQEYMEKRIEVGKAMVKASPCLPWNPGWLKSSLNVVIGDYSEERFSNPKFRKNMEKRIEVGEQIFKQCPGLLYNPSELARKINSAMI